MILVPCALHAQLRVYKTYADFTNDKPAIVRDDVHMNGSFRGEGEMEKFVDANDKSIKMDPRDYWGFTYDSLLFRCLPDQQMKYAAVLRFGEHLFMYYRGAFDLRQMANRDVYGKEAPTLKREDLHGLLEVKVAFSATLGSEVVLWDASKKDFIEHFSKYYKEDSITAFAKAFYHAGSDKARLEAIQELLKGQKGK